MRSVSPSEYTHEAPTIGVAAGDLWHASTLVGVPWRTEQIGAHLDSNHAAEGDGWGGEPRAEGGEGTTHLWAGGWGGRWSGERMPEMTVGMRPSNAMHPSSSSLANALVPVPQHTPSSSSLANALLPVPQYAPTQTGQSVAGLHAPTSSNMDIDLRYSHPHEVARNTPTPAHGQRGDGEPVLAHAHLGGGVTLPEGLRPPRPTYRPMGNRLASAHNRAISLMVST